MPSHLVRPKGCHQLVILKLKIIVEKESWCFYEKGEWKVSGIFDVAFETFARNNLLYCRLLKVYKSKNMSFLGAKDLAQWNRIRCI
jgi:hypothetical protein